MARTGDGDTFSGSPATSDAQASVVSADGRTRSSTPWTQVDSESAVAVIEASTSVFFSAAVRSAWLSRLRALAVSVDAVSAVRSACAWASSRLAAIGDLQEQVAQDR
jgi:hypothetical protein